MQSPSETNQRPSGYNEKIKIELYLICVDILLDELWIHEKNTLFVCMRASLQIIGKDWVNSHLAKHLAGLYKNLYFLNKDVVCVCVCMYKHIEWNFL